MVINDPSCVGITQTKQQKKRKKISQKLKPITSFYPVFMFSRTTYDEMVRKIENYRLENRKPGEEKPGEDKKSDKEEIVSETDEEKKEEMEAKLSQNNLTMGEIRVRNFAHPETSGEFSKRSADYDSLIPPRCHKGK